MQTNKDPDQIVMSQADMILAYIPLNRDTHTRIQTNKDADQIVTTQAGMILAYIPLDRIVVLINQHDPKVQLRASALIRNLLNCANAKARLASYPALISALKNVSVYVYMNVFVCVCCICMYEC